jgi:hypothetical protein
MTMQYEQLRSPVPDTTGGRFGLVVLLREGVAAWMAAPSARPVAAAGSANRNASVTERGLPTGTHADMIQVLANMAMATYQEKCI